MRRCANITTLAVALALAWALAAGSASAQVEQQVSLAAKEAQARQGRARPLLLEETLEVGLCNDRVALLVGRAGPQAGRLRLWDAVRGRWLIPQASPAINLAGLGRLVLAEAASSGAAQASYQIESFFEPGLGGGYRLEAEFPLEKAAGAQAFVLRAWLANGRSYVVLQLGLRNVAAATYQLKPGFEYLALEHSVFDHGRSSLTAIGESDRFFMQPATLDGEMHEVGVAQGAPLLFAGEPVAGGILAAALDWCEGPMLLRYAGVGGRASLGLYAWDTGPTYPPGAEIWSPRLLLQVAQAEAPAWAFEEYKQLMARLYPPAPVPDWVRYQWDSWYPYGVRVTEAALDRQVGYLSSRLNDLGSWMVVVDLGWYQVGEAAEAGWATPDPAKFPKGLRAVVDRAHARGVKVVVTLSLPVVYGATEAPGLNWLWLPSLVAGNPTWFLPLGDSRYLCDFQNPAFRRYFEDSVVRRLLEESHVDGVKLEGLAGGRLDTLEREGRLAQGEHFASASQTLAIYDAIHGAASACSPSCYLEGGWLNPPAAAPLAHCFRSAEERPAFRGEYPTWGLLEHVDEALAQRIMLGQRPHLGLVMESPGTSVLNRQWLGAAAALGAAVGLSFDLEQLSPQALTEYRGLLNALRPFQGSLRVEGGRFPIDVFGTVCDGSGYVAVVNREDKPVERLVDLSAVVGRAAEATCVYDVERGQFLLTRGGLNLRLEPNSLRLLITRTQPGMMWTSSATKVIEGNRGLAVWAWGPASVPGVLKLYCPALRSVVVGGQEVFASGIPPAWQGKLRYDYSTGVLTITYEHQGRQRFNIGLQPLQ